MVYASHSRKRKCYEFNEISVLVLKFVRGHNIQLPFLGNNFYSVTKATRFCAHTRNLGVNLMTNHPFVFAHVCVCVCVCFIFLVIFPIIKCSIFGIRYFSFVCLHYFFIFFVLLGRNFEWMCIVSMKDSFIWMESDEPNICGENFFIFSLPLSHAAMRFVLCVYVEKCGAFIFHIEPYWPVASSQCTIGSCSIQEKSSKIQFQSEMACWWL